MNPSVILSFRVKINSPLYKWLEAKAMGTESLSDVVRDIIEYHRLTVIDHEHFKAIKRNAELWHCMREYLRPDWGDSFLWENFWVWMQKEHSGITKI